MKPSTIAAIIVGSLVVLGAALYILSGNSDDVVVENQATSNPSQSESQNSEAAEKVFTAEEVAAHNSESDCWTSIDGNVYDITAYIPRHPGGDEILLACGTDGSSLFNQRQTADGERVGSGAAHSSLAANQLANFKIGTLK